MVMDGCSFLGASLSARDCRKFGRGEGEERRGVEMERVGAVQRQHSTGMKI